MANTALTFTPVLVNLDYSRTYSVLTSSSFVQ